MIICSHCSTVNHPDNVVCSHCGSPLAPDPALEGDPFIGRTLGGRFKLETIVGSGEIGMVYRGSDARSGTPVAVKIVHPDVASTLGDALLQAASVLAKLRHAKIATVLGAARSSDGTTFIVTEFLQGETLKNLLERNGPLGPRRTADILFQLCSALAPIHRAGRPHANLKPENVFLVERPDGSDFVKIVDAGSPELFGVHATTTGEIIVGTPKYFSPEQAMGREVGRGSDQFTLGIIGYQLLTGALPFFGATPDQLLSAIANGEPTPVGKRTTGVQLPEKLEQVIHRCLEKEPSRRYPDLRGLATDLASVIKTTQPAAPKPKRARFGAGVNASTVVASPELLASMKLDDEDDEEDDEATVMRNLPVDIEAAMRDAVGPAPQLFAEPAPQPSIPAPLMFTGALDQDEVMAQLSAASGGAARHRSSSPPANAPDLSNDLNAALAAAAAETSARAVPAPAEMPAPGGGFDPFADLGDVDDIELSPAVPARTSAPPAPSRPVAAPTPSPELSNAILDAISEELDDHRPERRPVASSPLATAADFAALSPEVISQARATTQPTATATPQAGSSGSGRTAMIVLITLLVVAVAGGAVWFFMLREPEAPVVSRRPKPPAKPKVAKLKVPLQIELRSTPTGAQVFDGAKALGKTPLALTLDEARPYRWKLTLEGHSGQLHTFDPTPITGGDTPTPVEVAMTKLGAATPSSDAGEPAAAPATKKQPTQKKPTKKKPTQKKPTQKKPTQKKPAKKKPTQKRPAKKKPTKKKPKTDPNKLRDPFGTKAKKLKNPFE